MTSTQKITPCWHDARFLERHDNEESTVVMSNVSKHVNKQHHVSTSVNMCQHVSTSVDNSPPVSSSLNK